MENKKIKKITKIIAMATAEKWRLLPGLDKTARGRGTELEALLILGLELSLTTRFLVSTVPETHKFGYEKSKLLKTGGISDLNQNPTFTWRY